MKENFRGIPTITNRKHEKKAKTIKNRFNQLALSLPRIDDKKRWAGMPGLTGVSRKLSRIISTCQTFVEPFAGLARVYQELIKLDTRKFELAVLNDNSQFIYNWLKENFKEPIIIKEDFVNVMREYNRHNSFYLIDQPWNKSYYDQSFSCFDRRTVTEYDIEILKELETFTGNFIITTRKENKRMLNSGYNNYLIQSEYVVSGRYPLVMLTTNMNLQGLQKAKTDLIE